MTAACPLCTGTGGTLVHAAPRFRVVRAEEDGFPAFWRVVWQAHMAEFSDLAAGDRAHCMEAVAQVEQVVRTMLAPAKVNLAAFGNMVPHLHWHVVARFVGDSHFPAPVWAAPRRARDAAAEEAVAAQLHAVDAALAQQLAATFGHAPAGAGTWQA